VVLHVSGTPDLSAASPAEAGVFARALAKDPADRFDSCREFARRLADARPAGPAEMIPSLPWPAGPGDPAARATGWGVAAGDTLPVFAPADGRLPAPSGLPATRTFDDLGRARAPDRRPAAELVLGVVRACLLGLADAPPGADGADVTDLFCRFTVRADRA